MTEKALSDRLEDWANTWYDYSFNDPSAPAYKGEMRELRHIIRQLRRKGL